MTMAAAVLSNATNCAMARMSRQGDVIENPITGEHVTVRVGNEETNGELLVLDTYLRPGAAVATVVRGRVGFRLDGRESIAEAGQSVHVPAGIAHDWWNADEPEALVQNLSISRI